MAEIIYKREHNDAAYGKIDTPIRMIIEHESDLLTKKGGFADAVFNIEKSSRFGETIVSNNGFSTFAAVAEGGTAVKDTKYESQKKFIEHIQFIKEFIITQTMMEDGVNGISVEAKMRAEEFTRAYYKTMHFLASTILANGHLEEVDFAGEMVSTTTGDGLPLFHKEHVWGKDIGIGKPTGKQSNAFYADLKQFGDGAVLSAEEALFEAAVKLRNMKDENGSPLGYTADTIIIPGNMPKLEMALKTAAGTEKQTGSNFNNINVQYGNWNVIVDYTWEATSPEFRIMSSEANRNLRGNMLFNRVPLTVRSFIDNHTWNNCWSGRCRFGAGFGTYKHILTIRDSATEVANYSAL